ncbi:DUF3150 domain-containing protein [Desulfovibrio litoralis]|uniref:DUF3150 domain-containing protein n=1 Tax=Desulfovibrio litoralis DSM 11393 TaxID=1121455 RepID=A0A1M7TQ19_9BACT|nr:DUF3150 domain-containing protein [Desulfovibrio litoralis]SHN72723.1 Protein of unknown function [Desulfovibrio litoralis DSM 11393]
MQTHTAILSNLLVFNLEVNIWSARKKLIPHDLGDAELPPDELASLGSKKICSPEELRIFGTLKARAVSLLDRNGVRFLSGWAIPTAKAEEINQELALIQAEFMTAKDSFLQRYDATVADWVAKHPNWENMLTNSIVNKDYVRSKLGFRWQLFKVETPDANLNSSIDAMLQEDVGKLGSTLFDEVAKAATEAWNRCYAGKTELTRKALSPLKAIYNKLIGLTFIEPRVAPIADIIETAFQSLPRRGILRGASLFMLQGLVMLLQNPTALMQHGQMILDGVQQSDDILATFTQNNSLEMTNINQEQDDNDNLSELDEEPLFVDEELKELPPVLDSYGLW